MGKQKTAFDPIDLEQLAEDLVAAQREAKGIHTGRRPPEGPASKLIRLLKKDRRFAKALLAI